jgi:dTDP-4-amino-4,6-dideoxygalactose transaminase
MRHVAFHKPSLGKEEENAVRNVLRSGWITKGPVAQRFEETFARYVKSPYAVGLNSCTAGMHLALCALGIGKGDEVITTPLTFAATANVVIHCGARVVFADVDPANGNIDPTDIARKITQRTRAVIIVHLAGCPCNMHEIVRLCRKNKLALIEDAAHALGAYYEGKHVGTFGDVGAFSFYATKNITTGEGGMAVTRNKKLAQSIKSLSQHGLSADAWKRFKPTKRLYYTVDQAGYKYNMFDIQAAIGIEQLKKNKLFVQRRNTLWERYLRKLGSVSEIVPPEVLPGTVHAKHLFIVTIKKNALRISRDAVMQWLQKLGVHTQVHFLSLHMHPFYRKLYKLSLHSLPQALMRSRQALSLPFYPGMSFSDLDYTVKMLKECIHKCKRIKARK